MADKPVHEVESVDAALDALSSPSSSDVFEAVDLFSSKAVAAVAAKRSLDGGGGSSSPNWCIVQIDGGPNLTVAAPSYYWPKANLSIPIQSGDDFSVGDGVIGGAIMSAAGGFFHAGLIVSPPNASGLDGGSSVPRWIQIGFTMGDLVPDLVNLGYDCSVQAGARGQQTFSGLPGLASPGGRTVSDLRALFENPFGTDSVNMERWDYPALVIWQIG